VPLDREVEFRTRLAPGEGRKRIAAASATIGDTIYAEAQAILITLPADHSIGI
jgi:hypothetical protein